MDLIDRIEINYFRSVYSVSVNKIRDLNVFLGSNDAGKSNVLRALNLFFNNESGYDEEIDFLQDVTHLRQSEARDAKGRLTIWIRIHFNNIEGWKTLPKKFYVKKTWNRYTDDPEIKSNVEHPQSLTRFLNKIRFHYVPAVKETTIFSDYLYLLYETLSETDDIEFTGPADQLSNAINASITDLTESIRLALKVRSNIQIPNDLKSIFERLEFFTDQDNFKVPLTRRGDGLQVRHIPHILNYVSQNNRSLNIWAYEEPENSLEMSNAFALASEFEKDFCKANQIFITSHSPAFYSIKSDRTKHYLVKKIERLDGDRTSWISSIEDLTNTHVADVELGVAQLVADRSQKAYDEIKRLRAVNDELSRLARPILLTEGKTDKHILEAAWKKLNPKVECHFDILSCDLGHVFEGQENAGADELKKILESTTKSQTPLRVGLFDRDGKGVQCFDNLKKHNSTNDNAEVKINDNKRSAAIILPEFVWGSPYDEYIGDSRCIEMMFPYEVIPADLVSFDFYIGQRKLTKEKGEKWAKKLDEAPDLFEDLPFRIVPKFQSKTRLAKALGKLDAEHFDAFEPVFEAFDKGLAAC